MYCKSINLSLTITIHQRTKKSFTTNWRIPQAQWCRAKETNNHNMHCTSTCSAIDQSMLYS